MMAAFWTVYLTGSEEGHEQLLQNAHHVDPKVSIMCSSTLMMIIYSTRCCEIEDVEGVKRIAPPLQPTQMDAQGHPWVRFVAYGILFNVIEAIFEFPFHSGDI